MGRIFILAKAENIDKILHISRMWARFAFLLMLLIAMCAYALAQDNTANYWYEKGIELVNIGSYDEAINAYDKATQIAPENSDAWLGKASVFILMRKDNESQEAFRKALDIANKTLIKNPEDAEAWQNKGIAIANLGQREEAIKAFEKVIEISDRILEKNPKDAEFWWLKAENLEILGRKEAAIKAYDKIIELNSSRSVGALVRKAHILGVGLIDYNESVQTYSKAFELMLENNTGKPITSKPITSIWSEKDFSIFTNIWFGPSQILMLSQGLYNESNKSFDRYLEINAVSMRRWSMDIVKSHAAGLLDRDDGKY
ncbi:MAG: tetratricopeptide repeat protein [Methanotrichaceae archaeon]